MRLRRAAAGLLASVGTVALSGLTTGLTAPSASAGPGWAVTADSVGVEDQPILLTFRYHLSSTNNSCIVCGGVQASLKPDSAGVTCPGGQDDSGDKVLSNEAAGTPGDFAGTAIAHGVAAGAWLLCSYFHDSTGVQQQASQTLTVARPPLSLRLGVGRTAPVDQPLEVTAAYVTPATGRTLQVRIVPGRRCPANPYLTVVRGEKGPVAREVTGMGRQGIVVDGQGDRVGRYVACGWLLRQDLVEATARPLTVRIAAAHRG